MVVFWESNFKYRMVHRSISTIGGARDVIYIIDNICQMNLNSALAPSVVKIFLENISSGTGGSSWVVDLTWLVHQMVTKNKPREKKLIWYSTSCVDFYHLQLPTDFVAEILNLWPLDQFILKNLEIRRNWGSKFLISNPEKKGCRLLPS